MNYDRILKKIYGVLSVFQWSNFVLFQTFSEESCYIFVFDEKFRMISEILFSRVEI